MSRYHINNNGEVKLCSARIGNCLFKNEDLSEKAHYQDKREAELAAENILKATIEVLPLKKSAKDDLKEVISSKGSNVSLVSNMCEDAMADDADVNNIAQKISEIDDSRRVIALRKLNKEQIDKVLNDWRTELNSFVEKRTGVKDFKIHSGNIGGNSADSDFIVMSKGKVLINLEAKFGSATNGAIGIQRASNLTDFPAFNLSKEEKDELLRTYSEKGESAVISGLSQKMNDYASEFNKEKRSVDSQEIYDIVKSSGKTGNSVNVKDYSIVNFRQKEGEGQIHETELSLKEDENWDVRAVVSVNDGTARLSYLFETSDKQKQLKVLFNNKNSLYAAKDENGDLKVVNKKNYDVSELTRIQSKLQMGTGSYNVWYREGLELEES